VGWTLAAEYVIVVRDPGFLSLSGIWLVNHGSTDIPLLGADAASQAQANLLAGAPEAWNVLGEVVQPQGAKMLPATIAVGGWIAGTTGVLAANVVIGGLGILALYALARQVLGPLAALAPAGGLALTVAHVGLSRPAYSEPLTLLLILTAALWAWRGLVERKVPLMIAAGAASGATALVRIDGALFAAGALAGLAIATSLIVAAHSPAPDAGVRRRLLVAFAATQATVLGIGYFSLWRWSRAYLDRLATEAGALTVLYALVFFGSLALAVAWGGRIDRVMRWAQQSRRLALGSGVTVSLVLVAFATRPLWLTVRRSDESARERFISGVVESFQTAQGLPIDPQRTYAESTITWMSLYLTWPVVVLAIIGLGIITARAFRRDQPWMLVLGALLIPTMLYLYRPSIVPDQIWAIRRLEPSGVPAFLLAAAVAAWALVRLIRDSRWRWRATVVGAIALVGLPLTTWLSINPAADVPVSVAVNATTREWGGARTQIEELCELADGRPVVLLGSSSHFGSIRTMCEVPVVLGLTAITPESMREISAAWGQAPVILTRDERKVTWTEPPGYASETTAFYSRYTLQDLPRSNYSATYRWFAGLATADGTVAPLPALTP
jgi:hypothetical protein